MQILRQCLIMASLATALAAAAQGPNATGRYYRPANGKAGAELKTALFQIIGNPNVVSYGTGLKQAYIKTDTRPDGFLRDFYSCITSYVPGSDMAAGQYEGYNYNREHTVCQSWFGSESPMYSDVVMVLPTDGYVNSRRNNNPFGEVTDQASQVKTSAEGYSKWGAPRKDLGCPAEVTTVFEPNDEVKGDIARIYFYMATCYEDRATTFTRGTGQYVFNAEGTACDPLQPWVLAMMMRWSEQDPVDSIETARNNAVQQVQGNRNPFVDYPGLEQYIWGDRRQEPFVYGDDDGDDPVDEPSQSGTIVLNNAFFGVDWTGQRPSGGVISMTGQQGGLKVTYAKGSSGQSMFCSDKQIRLYKYNTLTFTISDADMERIDFNVVRNDNNKEFFATCGTVDGYTWSGPARDVTFTVTEGNGNVQLASVYVLLSEVADGIASLGHRRLPATVFDMQGRPVQAPLRPGIYVQGGRKFVVR